MNGERQFLPRGWERAYDKNTNRYYYVDHNTKSTTWLNPLDRETMPRSCKECRGDQLPYGWEKIIDPVVGCYYTDHIGRRNQWTNPVADWHQRIAGLSNQHHYSNSLHILYLERSGNSLDSNNRTLSPTNTSKPDTSIRTSDIEKSATSLNISTNLDTEFIDSTRSNTSTKGSHCDASLLNIMDNCFGRNSSQSVEV